MSLFGEPVEAWVEAAQTCVPEDIVDIADQLALVTPPERQTEIADTVGPIVMRRAQSGEMAETLANHWAFSTARYSSDVPTHQTR